MAWLIMKHDRGSRGIIRAANILGYPYFYYSNFIYENGFTHILQPFAGDHTSCKHTRALSGAQSSELGSNRFGPRCLGNLDLLKMVSRQTSTFYRISSLSPRCRGRSTTQGQAGS